MYLGFITVYVADFDRAKAFYVEIGFDVRYDEPMPDGYRWLMLSPQNAQTAIVPHGPGRPNDWSPERVGGFLGHGFEVSDVFETHRAWLARGVRFPEAPSMEYFGGWAQFEDSEGNVWGLHSPARVGAPA